ncbi:MAG: AlpA family phage regulatory protein [Rhodospirillaceae bacterium]|nr:AlpA family phage regulatory protein [Rhodospirillaceae bacterium]
MRLTGLSMSTIHRKWRSGEIPAPLKFFRDGRAFGWKQSEILDWMRSRECAE